MTTRWERWRQRFSLCARAATAVRDTSVVLQEATRGLVVAGDEEARAAAEALEQARLALEAAHARLVAAMQAVRPTAANREVSYWR